MPKYAKDQSADFKNAIERVAIVGVSKTLNNGYTTKLIKKNTFRLEAPLDRTLPPPSSKLEDTQSQPYPAKTATTNYPPASSSPQSTTTTKLPSLPPSKASNS